MRCVPWLCLSLTVIAAADEPPKPVKAGDLLPGPFHVYNVTGERKDKLSCLVCRNGLNPVVAIFARGSDDAVLPELFQKLDATVARHADVRMGAFAIFLHEPGDDPRNELLDKLVALEKDKELKHVVLALAPADWKDLPPAYALPEDVTTRVVLYYRHRIKAIHDFTKDKPLTDKNAEMLLQEADKLVPARVQPPKEKPATGVS